MALDIGGPPLGLRLLALSASPSSRATCDKGKGKEEVTVMSIMSFPDTSSLAWVGMGRGIAKALTFPCALSRHHRPPTMRWHIGGGVGGWGLIPSLLRLPWHRRRAAQGGVGG
jgi:hypothetical protein